MATTAFSIDRFLHAPLLARVREVEEGLPVDALRALIDGDTITLSDLVGIVGSRRTLDRRLADGGRLSLEESDRLARFAEVLALTEHVIGGRAAAIEWLKAPQFEFDGITPITLMRTHAGTDLVVNLLRMMQHGMLA